MKLIYENIFNNLPSAKKDEVIEEIINSGNYRIERIISEGQSSPENFWYEQNENEFVILLQGEAVIQFYDKSEKLLKPGDYLLLPAKLKHRIKKTSKSTKTIWLAFFFED